MSRLRWCETTLSTKALTTPVSLQLSGNSLRSALSTSPLNWRVAYLQSFPLSSQRPLTMFTPAWAAAMPAVCLPQPAVGGRVGHVGGRVGGRVAGVGRFKRCEESERITFLQEREFQRRTTVVVSTCYRSILLRNMLPRLPGPCPIHLRILSKDRHR